MTALQTLAIYIYVAHAIINSKQFYTAESVKLNFEFLYSFGPTNASKSQNRKRNDLGSIYTCGDGDVILTGFRRHLVRKTLINVFHCDSAEIRFVGKIVIIQTFS